MVSLTIGKVPNSERKFIPTKKPNFEKYIGGLLLIEEYTIIQTFLDGFKYRCYDDGNGKSYTKTFKDGDISNICEIDEQTFNSALKNAGKSIVKCRKTYSDGQRKIDVDYFEVPLKMVMVEVSSNEEGQLCNYAAPEGFIEVTKNIKYDNKNIFNGSILATGVILEGSDAVGKTTAIQHLVEDGIICQDRCNDVISKYMMFDVPMEVRVTRYHDYLKTLSGIVIIMVNNDGEELMRRVKRRAKISAFDKDTVRYNLLYVNTFKEMYERNMREGKMYLLNCTDLSIDETVYKLKNLILSITK